MAMMIPENIEVFDTEGEKQFYLFLKAIAKPDSSYITWYHPDLNERKPDFILFSKDLGLIIFEVKDWCLNQIREVNRENFIIIKEGQPRSQRNPLTQAEGYLGNLMDVIKNDGKLVSKDPLHHGNPRIPIQCGVVFANINKYAYQEKHFDLVIPINKVFFWDDMHPESDICKDATGSRFFESLKEKFPPLFKLSLTGNDYNYMKQLIFQIVRIDIPKRTACEYERTQQQVKVLDNNREAIARKLDNGHQIISGPSG